MSIDIPRKTGTAAVWSDIGRVPTHPSGGVFTIAGRAFCVSGRSGNIAELGPQGFFSNDTRFLSGLHLLVNGVDPEVVDVTSIDADEAVFFLRSRAIEQDEHAEPGLVVRRHRYQGPTLHEDIIIENRSGSAASVTVELQVSVDFGAQTFTGNWTGGQMPANPSADPSFTASGVVQGQHIVATAFDAGVSGQLQGSFFRPEAQALGGAYDVQKAGVGRFNDTFSAGRIQADR